MSSSRKARGFARRLTALSGGAELLRKAAARELGRMDPTDATDLIGGLIQLYQAGDAEAAVALAAVVSALLWDTKEIPYAKALKRLADLQELQPVSALFTAAPPQKEMHADAAARADAKLFTESLGHLKTKARLTKNPDELAKLATASDPTVVRNVLLNPRLTEPQVVRIAARRPARPEPLVEIWKSPRWSVCHAVRRALVLNPYLPPEVGSKIVPLLNAVDLDELAKNTAVHQALREQARQLLQRGEPAISGASSRPPTERPPGARASPGGGRGAPHR
ncbi:MAG: hypothetical protein ACOZIN_10965 [Myxococcota bacterium]